MRLKIIDKIRRDSFRGRIFFLLAAGSTSTVIVLTLFWLAYAWHAIAQTAQRDLQTIAVRTSGEIDQYLSGKTDSLMAVRELLSYPDEDRFKLELMLKRISLEFDQFKRLSLYEASNELVASSDDDEGTVLPEEVLNVVSKGEIYRSPMLLTKDNLPYIRMAIPLFWQGEVFRILLADVNILDIWNKIDGIKIGKTGRASIVSSEGFFLADVDKERVVNMRCWHDVSRSELPLAEKEGTLNGLDRNGTSLDIAYATIPSTGWLLVITQERSERMHFLIVMLLNAFVIILLCIVGAYYLSATLARRMSRPIEELHRGVDEISKGNFRYQVPAFAGREMEALGIHLNEMAKILEEKEQLDRKLAGLERLASVGRLAADVAHEINNPLGIITNYIYMVKQEMIRDGAQNLQSMDIISEEIGRISRIVHSFKELYKGISVLKLNKEAPLLTLQDVLAFCRLELEERGINIVEEMEQVGTVMADSDKLEQVFLNIIKNAMEAMPEGGTLKVKTCMVDGKIDIAISDTGTGISKENLPKIFDPFFSTKGVKGTGLGLSVSYGLIKNFNGDIEVECEEGKGTTFKVILPVVEE